MKRRQASKLSMLAQSVRLAAVAALRPVHPPAGLPQIQRLQTVVLSPAVQLAPPAYPLTLLLRTASPRCRRTRRGLLALRLRTSTVGKPSISPQVPTAPTTTPIPSSPTPLVRARTGEWLKVNRAVLGPSVRPDCTLSHRERRRAIVFVPTVLRAPIRVHATRPPAMFGRHAKRGRHEPERVRVTPCASRIQWRWPRVATTRASSTTTAS